MTPTPYPHNNVVNNITPPLFLHQMHPAWVNLPPTLVLVTSLLAKDYTQAIGMLVYSLINKLPYFQSLVVSKSFLLYQRPGLRQTPLMLRSYPLVTLSISRTEEAEAVV